MTAITFCKVKTFQNKIRLQIFAVILPIRRHFRTKRDSKYFAAILPKSIELFSHNFLQYFNILSHRFDRISPPFSWANWIVFTYFFFCKLSKDFDNVDGSRAAGLTLPGLPLIWQNFAAAILLRQLNGFHVFSFFLQAISTAAAGYDFLFSPSYQILTKVFGLTYFHTSDKM